MVLCVVVILRERELEDSCVSLCSYSVCEREGVRGAFCGTWCSHCVREEEEKRVGGPLCSALCSSIES